MKGSTAAPAQTSETWQRLRKKDETFLKNLNTRGKAVAGARKMKATTADTEPNPKAAATSAAPVAAERGQSTLEPSDEQLRDYIGAFVLAGLDPQVGAEANFFADQVHYYNDGLKDRNKIRQDLRRYDERWPQRKFWLAGDLIVDRVTPELLRVSFPLRFELRNGQRHASGRVVKTLVLQPVGDDFQIVGLNERKAK